MDEDPEKVAGLAPSFAKWGGRWECVGWAPPRRTAPTLVWKVEALEGTADEGAGEGIPE